MRQGKRRTIAVAAALATGAGLVAVACVIADPPAEIPIPPITRPTILHDEVWPPPTSILRVWPTQFVMVVDVQDPSSIVRWEAYLDYDPAAPPPNAYAGGSLPPDALGDDGGLRTLTASVHAPQDGLCHTLELLVALGFNGHTPDAPGGDSVTWFYSPSGSLDTCAVFDAGIPDAADAEPSDAPSVFIPPPEDDGGDQ